MVNGIPLQMYHNIVLKVYYCIAVYVVFNSRQRVVVFQHKVYVSRFKENAIRTTKKTKHNIYNCINIHIANSIIFSFNLILNTR